MVRKPWCGELTSQRRSGWRQTNIQRHHNGRCAKEYAGAWKELDTYLIVSSIMRLFGGEFHGSEGGSVGQQPRTCAAGWQEVLQECAAKTMKDQIRAYGDNNSQRGGSNNGLSARLTDGGFCEEVYLFVVLRTSDGRPQRA